MDINSYQVIIFISINSVLILNKSKNIVFNANNQRYQIPLYIYVFIQPQNYNTFFTYEQFNAFFSKNSPKILSIQKKCLPLHRNSEIRAFSSAGSEHLPYKQRVGGSNPSTPTNGDT